MTQMHILGSVFVATLFLFVFPSQTTAGSEAKFFENKSVRLWMMTTFLDWSQKYNSPTESEVAEGTATYNDLKASGSSEVGNSGVISELDIKKLQEVVNLWARNGLISDATKDEELSILELDTFKTVRENVLVKSNGELVYSLTGLIKLSKKPATGSVFYVFRKFKLSQSPNVRYNREDDCKLWGMICKTTFAFNDEFTNEENVNLANYMRSQALKQFTEENGQYTTYFNTEAGRYERFLPEDVKTALQELNENPDKKPDEVLSEDPLDGNKFDM